MRPENLVVSAAAEGPLADWAYVYVDELAYGVVAYAASLEAEGGVAELAGGDAGDADVDGFGQGVLGVFGYTGVGGAGAEEVVAPGGTVAADDVDDGVRPTELAEQVVQEVELPGIVVAGVFGAVVAEEVVELREGGRDVGVSYAVDDIDVFAGVQVVELEVILGADHGEGVGRGDFAGG